MTEHNTFGPIRTLDAAELILWTVYDPPRLLASYCLCSPSLFALLHFLYLLPVLATEEMMDDEELWWPPRPRPADRRFSRSGTAGGRTTSSFSGRVRRGLAGLEASALPRSHPRHPERRVRCPICRSVGKREDAIFGVKGLEIDSEKNSCCVCLGTPPSVCLPCGHLCVCERYVRSPTI